MARILIVDDEVENLKSLKRALGDENPEWEILTAENEADGEEVLRNHLKARQPIDVVLTDLVMDSEQSGMNILQKARELDPLVMAILFTAKEKSLDRYTAFDYGAFDVVEKNIRGTAASREINIKTRAALRYREWSQQITFLRRYFDPKLFDVIQRNQSLLAVSQRIITIAFWDIRGFSRLCESLKAHPTLISGFLKDYCELGADTIFRHNGVLDKFIGDGIMALFGVLNHKGDKGKSEAVSAVKAAIDLRDEFADVVAKWMDEWRLYVPDKIEIGLGCGIHTGEALVGNVGTDSRDQFTALGPHVNFASRIESRARAGQILLSQSTEARTKGDIAVSPAGEISDIKNIPGKFQLYEVSF
ncbi:MAG: adenylate/guanylate cyclase domain-containing protein [Sedimentisphaerales bacterium]|jgi:class 3 adenylate cyclase|nr:adenylate/guanylate cyclase domain-containing protein [Sedimentisphaerales bacterium]HNY80045.1 adenylate/guanylate cyclase domain-containing protein [Sedimentisphaerales bacterium]HOC64928.1 adenylate/guanylate cyclase domain-containing protein [Sedimentisphaerales bacterium]HOH65904.1 adenylate/guanylate cyclase domain-containing protein [Sedimentisphaerales bacterium]HQA91488.1 adenylate/guanylate cyclase domain-containing protein [Sedimentisphaerales bacterium]